MKTARSGDFFPRVCCNLLRVHVSGLCHCSNQSPRHCGSSYAATWCGFPVFICCWNSMGIGLIINSIQPDSWQEKALFPQLFGLKTLSPKNWPQLENMSPKGKKDNKTLLPIGFHFNQIKPIKLITNLSLQRFRGLGGSCQTSSLPGRLDRLLYVPLPSSDGRPRELEIWGFFLWGKNTKVG